MKLTDNEKIQWYLVKTKTTNENLVIYKLS